MTVILGLTEKIRHMAETKIFIVNTTLFVFSWIVAVLGVDEVVLTSLAILLLVDWLSGIGKSFRMGRPIESKYGTVGFISKFSVMGIPLTVALMGKALGKDLSLLVDVTFSAMVVNEGYSALTNMYAMYTKKELPEWSIMEILFGKLQKAFLAMISYKPHE